MGVKTKDFDALLHVFQTVMGLEVIHREEENEFFVLTTSGGDKVELFGPRSKYNTHLAMARPVVGFSVDDINKARKELQSVGIDLIGDINRRSEGYAWQHFRGPDGNIHELTYGPAKV